MLCYVKTAKKLCECRMIDTSCFTLYICWSYFKRIGNIVILYTYVIESMYLIMNYLNSVIVNLL